MDRRTTIKWVLAASAAWPQLTRSAAAAQAGNTPPAPAGTAPAPVPGSKGYGTDPNLIEPHHPGEFWPLTLTAPQRRLASMLADLIIPADDHSPSATSVGVVDFIDEWISAPYPGHERDRAIVLEGFRWLDAEAGRRFGKGFADLDATQQSAICDDICDAQRAPPARQDAARFFAVFRDVTAGGFYSSPAGRKDVGYIGNLPLKEFPGPPPELLSKLNLL
jgi:hypothetical protein